MANNELSGPIVIMSLIDYFRSKKLNYGLRFVIIPETIGAISYIHRNLNSLRKNVFCGFNVTCVGTLEIILLLNQNMKILLLIILLKKF